ncbi:hypothetical protein QBC38DRAFT_345929, partial [Podospora fimiseda]
LLLLSQTTSSQNLIDPILQPYCDSSSCWHWSFPPPELCPLVINPSCPNNTDASENIAAYQNKTENKAAKCGINQYQQDCYCNLKTGLSCVWSCSWEIWWKTEDWLQQTCPPNSPATNPLNFSPLPPCAKNCLDDSLFQYGCLTQTSNCFCSRGDLFDCHKKCHKEKKWRQIQEWLQDVCDINEAAAVEDLKSGRFSL